MDFPEFEASLGSVTPPELSPLLTALWWDRRGEWEKAHAIAQDIHSADGAWVHAYLHRREGDTINAGYWYRQAGRPNPRNALEEEWKEIAEALLLKV